MTYVIEITPDRLTIVSAQIETPADLAALRRVIDTVEPIIGAGVNRPEEITREPRQAKALRALAAAKEIRPEPQEPADLEQDEAAERIDPRPLPPEAERVEPVATLPGRVEKPAADRHDEPAVVRRVTKAGVPPDRDEKLKKLWADGLSTQRIADELGMGTSSNVSYRAKWLGLAPRARGGDRRSKQADTFDPSYYARHAIIPDRDEPPLGADITAALMGDPGHGPSLTVERAGPQQRGGEAI